MTFKKSELFRLYFLLLRAFYVISGLMSFYFAIGSFDLFSAYLIGIGLLILGAQFYGSLVAERLVTEKNYWGTLLGLALALLILVSFGFPVAILGMYSLLNKEHRLEYYQNELPVWFEKFLKQLDSINGPKEVHFNKIDDLE